MRIIAINNKKSAIALVFVSLLLASATALGFFGVQDSGPSSASFPTLDPVMPYRTIQSDNSATTFVVTKVADTNDGACDADCSLREAIGAANAAASNDVISFDPGVFNVVQTITLSGTALMISNNGSISINGPGRDLLSISGNHVSQIFKTVVGTSASFSGMHITDGYTPSGPGTGYGGGIYGDFESVMVVDNCRFSDNTADNSGGGIQSYGDLTITNSVFINNICMNPNNGSAISAGANLVISNSTISGNAAHATGAAIFGSISTKGNVPITTITDTTITGNAGGGIRHHAARLNVSRSIISSNSGSGINIINPAGVIPVNVLNELTIIGNLVGIDSRFNTTLTNSVINGNMLGGIFHSQGTMSMDQCTVHGNGSSGISVSSNTNLNLSNSTVSNNTGASSGGGLNFSGAVFNATNVTIAGNVATMGGGMSTSGTTTNLTNVTICNNSATGGTGGGGINTGGFGVTNIKNTIIADNIAGAGPDIRGVVNSLGYNLIENPTETAVNGSTIGNILGKDPRQALLKNNGGTTLTVSLHATSPAIDAGDPNSFPATDQRGQPRPADGDLNGTELPDIGAYERQPVTFTVTKTADTNDGVCDADCSLREAVAAMNSSQMIDKVAVFDAILFSTAQTISLLLGDLITNNAAGSMTVSGRGSSLLTLDAGHQTRVFTNTSGTDLTLDQLTITNGNGSSTIEPGEGGGVCNSDGQLTIANSTLRENTAARGGGLSVVTGAADVFNSLVTNNTATERGGGVANNGTVSVFSSSMMGNVSASGGGLHNGSGSSASIFNSTFHANTLNAASGNGGGIYNAGSTSISSSTLDGNLTGASGAGGGIFNSDVLNLSDTTISGNMAMNGAGIEHQAGTVTAGYTTIAFNTTTSTGGGVRNSGSGTFNAKDVLIARNDASGGAPDYSGNLQSAGYNLIGNTSGAVISGIFGRDVLNVDPLLDPQLKNNGGDTKTHALAPNSPAVDKGAFITPRVLFDQRGLTRSVDFPTIPNVTQGNGSDIGAYERQLVENVSHTQFDYDGDGKSDVSVFRPSTGAWYLQRSSAGFYGQNFGSAEDRITPADYDGDGKTDIAVYRPSTGIWYVTNSATATVSYYGFGIAEDLPTPADYDGDGKADISVFRRSTGTWYRINSSDGSFAAAQFGTNGDKPAIGDFDGDGKADLSVFRPATGAWYQTYSSNGSFFGEQFGISTDKITPADYDGDGKTDIAIYRPSEGLWYVKRSATTTYVPYVFGLSADIPAPGDFDGDGKADIGVFRPSDGTWYIVNSSNSSYTIFQFGQSGDTPTQSAFNN